MKFSLRFSMTRKLIESIYNCWWYHDFNELRWLLSIKQNSVKFIIITNSIFFFHSFYAFALFCFYSICIMIFFDQFAFVINEFQNNFFIQIVNRVRAHQFQMFRNFFEFIISLVANSTRLISKRFLIDIIDIVNQSLQKRFRDKFRKNVDRVIQTVVLAAFKIKKMSDRRSNYHESCLNRRIID